MPQTHIMKAYDEELSELKQLIAEMGGRVEVLLADAIRSLITYDAELASSVIAADKMVDALEERVNQQVTRMLALRQPMAADLRDIIAALKISSDLERMGDYAKNISKRTKTLSREPLLSSAGKSVERLGKMVEDMIRSVLDAYLQKDSAKAVAMIEMDEEVDQLHTSMFREILTYMMEDPRNITACTHFLFITKNIERIGDHATNIAEQIYYAAEGHHIDESRTKADKSSSITADTAE